MGQLLGQLGQVLTACWPNPPWWRTRAIKVIGIILVDLVCLHLIFCPEVVVCSGGTVLSSDLFLIDTEVRVRLQPCPHTSIEIAGWDGFSLALTHGTIALMHGLPIDMSEVWISEHVFDDAFLDGLLGIQQLVKVIAVER